MLDGILGRGFSSKCKTLIKATGSRIELARRRAEAKQRFLKEDLAKLVATGFAVNAYGRTEEFMAGERILSCYAFIELSCEHIKKQLSSMQKQSGCPEDCREAVASLIFAAARFSDLPELRDLRDLFLERYGNGLECFVNQKFVEQLASKTPAMEKRIQLLHNIASEFQVQWDSAGFQHKMSSGEGDGKPNKTEPSNPLPKTSKPSVQNVLPEASKGETPNDIKAKSSYSHERPPPYVKPARESSSEISGSKPRSSRRSRHKSPEDEEEKVIDKLLVHYSRKTSDYDIEKLRRKGGPPAAPPPPPPQPARSLSFPHEQTAPSSETPKVYARANTFQPDHQARHVHPKLPDYEDLAAQFAALRGK